MQTPVEQVRAAADVVHFISRYVNLKKAGRTYKALCPFHTEKTPSFVVFPETGRWHCFGCGEGGDIFSFLMKVENLSFPEALRRLAEGVGVSIAGPRAGPEAQRAKDQLYAANEAAAVYYHGILLNSEDAQSYVKARGIKEDSIRRFLLGLAPEGEAPLRGRLKDRGFSDQELLAAGLLYEPEAGPVRDRYRGRLMFPIRDRQGHIVSFGARALSPEAQPKYLNGPQTDLFDKGGTLFGLDTAAQAIRRDQRAVVVEGYVDVVIAQQEGFENVVATLGTSITERQLRELARLAPEICLALDSDEAGQNAAIRAGEVGGEALGAASIPGWRALLGFERASLTVAVLPQAMDPDQLILDDPERWRAAVAAARPVFEEVLDWVGGRYDLESVAGKRGAAEVLVPLLAAIPEPVTRAHYAELAAQRLRVDSRAVSERVQRALRPSSRSAAGKPGQSANSPGRPAPATSLRAQVYAIALVAETAHRGSPIADLKPDDFPDPAMRGLLLRIQEALGGDARNDWRPDILEGVGEPWLEDAVSSVREALPAIHPLSDAEVASEALSVSLELTELRLAMELSDLQALAQDAEGEDAQRLKALIGERARARAQAQRDRSGVAPRPIPWRYRLGEEAGLG